MCEKNYIFAPILYDVQKYEENIANFVTANVGSFDIGFVVVFLYACMRYGSGFNRLCTGTGRAGCNRADAIGRFCSNRAETSRKALDKRRGSRAEEQPALRCSSDAELRVRDQACSEMVIGTRSRIQPVPVRRYEISEVASYSRMDCSALLVLQCIQSRIRFRQCGVCPL